MENERITRPSPHPRPQERTPHPTQLISELSKSNELSHFAGALQRRRQYDQCEQEYIENQRLRNELGTEYESSDSEEEKENLYNRMPHYELKRLMRKNLVEKKFDELVLVPVADPKEKEQENDELTTVRLISDEPLSSADIRTPTELNIIEEAKEIVEEEQEKESNFGL